MHLIDDFYCFLKNQFKIQKFIFTKIINMNFIQKMIQKIVELKNVCLYVTKKREEYL